jgi:hypothetical protein
VVFPEDDGLMENEIDHELLSEAETAWAQREWSIQHVLFPSIRLFFKPPTSMASNGTFVRVIFIPLRSTLLTTVVSQKKKKKKHSGITKRNKHLEL